LLLSPLRFSLLFDISRYTLYSLLSMIALLLFDFLSVFITFAIISMPPPLRSRQMMPPPSPHFHYAQPLRRFRRFAITPLLFSFSRCR